VRPGALTAQTFGTIKPPVLPGRTNWRPHPSTSPPASRRGIARSILQDEALQSSVDHRLGECRLGCHDRDKLVGRFKCFRQQLESLAARLSLQRAKVNPREKRDIEHADAQGVTALSGALQRRHRPGEPVGGELGVQHGPRPEVREALREPPESHCERPMALPVADDTAPVACLDDAIRAEDDQPANAVDLRPDGNPFGLADGGQEVASPSFATSCGTTSSTQEL
jgi:hypothetical protein